MGERFSQLEQHKRFCWGEDSLDPRTRKALKNANFGHQGFQAGHWVMIDAVQKFYGHMAAFFIKQEKRKLTALQNRI